MPRLFLLWLWMVPFSIASHAAAAADPKPSFDCDRAHSPVERAICSDKQLARLDGEMARVYRNRMAPLDETERAALVNDQRGWLRFRAPSCLLPDAGPVTSEEIAIAVPCLSKLYGDRIGVLKERCKVDPDHTVEDMANWDKPWSTMVPRGFRVEQEVMTFEVTWEAWITTSYSLPSETLPAARRASAGLKKGYQGLALCRVIGPDGKRWLASPMRDGTLNYVLESATEPVP
ncbi:MAG TPA: lysozyme inhibitor LprI family protein [Stellaceae bacterium]|nr:lysozyme inhibitor LprI family protein [Stellaceae bacterium]